MKPYIWQVLWLDFVYISVYQKSKHSQWFKHWPFLLTDQGWTDGQTTHKVIIALFERTFQSVESVDVPAGRAILRHYPQTSMSGSPSDILETGSVFQSLIVAEKKLVLSPPPFKWSWFLSFPPMETTFVISFLLSWTARTFWKMVYSKRKEFTPSGSKFFPLREDPFSEGNQSDLTVVSPESILCPLNFIDSSLCSLPWPFILLKPLLQAPTNTSLNTKLCQNQTMSVRAISEYWPSKLFKNNVDFFQNHIIYI